MIPIQELRNRLERRKGKKQQIIETLSILRAELQALSKSLVLHEKAKEVIREVGIKTQQQLVYHISDITSLALDTIFDDPYSLEVEFVQRRNKNECDLLFVRNGERIDPLSASGGGAVDVASFALRIASWSMQMPHSRNTIILDEPLKFLSMDHQEQASQMIKEISKRLNIQFIIITHNEVLASYADKTFTTSINNGKTTVT
jgi:DNA repair exonuclease SbcCD ATPase subunit